MQIVPETADKNHDVSSNKILHELILACTKRRNVETKRPKRNGRNHRNDRNETTETKRPKRNSRKYKLQEKWKTLKYEIYGKFY